MAEEESAPDSGTNLRVCWKLHDDKAKEFPSFDQPSSA